MTRSLTEKALNSSFGVILFLFRYFRTKFYRFVEWEIEDILFMQDVYPGRSRKIFGQIGFLIHAVHVVKIFESEGIRIR